MFLEWVALMSFNLNQMQMEIDQHPNEKEKPAVLTRESHSHQETFRNAFTNCLVYK